LEHYLPAFDSGFAAHTAEIDAIVNNPDAPTFENTILALENSGRLLDKVNAVFSNVNGADGGDDMKEIEAELKPRLTAHSDEINMNEKLFARVKSVYDKRKTLGLDNDDIKLIEHFYKNFVRGGTNLPPDKKTELKVINEKLSKLTTDFGQKLLAENKKFCLIIDKKEDLVGLPESSIISAADLAKENNNEGK
jgi:peptidyl-dipeptidase Dcp